MRLLVNVPAVWPRVGLILLALVSISLVRAEKGAVPGQESAKAKPSAAPGRNQSQFELRVVGPDGKPVADALVHIRADPAPTAEQIRHGKFLKRGSYGAFLAADRDGRLVFEFTPVLKSLDVDITTPGFGPYWASWSSEDHDETIPTTFTAVLEAGWSVGGIIVDPEGKPVEGATVTPSIEFKKRPGDLGQLGIGTRLKTDAAGRWRFDSVPVSMSEVWVGIDHPRFKSASHSLGPGKFGIKLGEEPEAKIALDRGLTITGRVTDDSGKPIVGALIRTKFVNDIREAKTGADGHFELVGCEPRKTRIVVSAKGRATDMKELAVEPGMGPVDFKMKPGGTVRIRVVDAKGNPIPKARIFFQQWRGQFEYFEFNHVSQYTDQKGVWEWNEAPLDEFSADICPPDGMELERQPIIARTQEYVFRTSPALVVSGKVVDAVTKNPIKRFRVVPGFRASEKEVHYARNENYIASDGRYTIRRTRAEFDIIRIEADGYRPSISREIKSDEGRVSIDFELTEGKNVAARVFTPANRPAAGAKVALGLAGSQINIKNGEIVDPTVYCAREDTDATGRFYFPAQEKDFQLVITHPSGFAHIKSAPDWDLTRIIHLEPWARVEGTLRIGKALGSNVPMQLNVNRLPSAGRNEPRFYVEYSSVTGPDGRFVFERVVPGKGPVGRRLVLSGDEGATEVTSSVYVRAEFVAGKTNHVNIGGTGRAVVGKLRPPEGFKDKVRWNFALVDVRSVPAVPDGTRPRFTATVDRDGAFRIDDVPAGDHVISVYFFQGNAPGRIVDHAFHVPAAKDDTTIDLGPLTLENR